MAMGIQPKYSRSRGGVPYGMGIMPVMQHPMSGPMGACPAGYYDLKILGVDTGQCLPELDTALSAAQGGVTGSVATGASQSAANIAAAKNWTASSIGNWIVNNPLMVGGIVLGAAAVIYMMAKK